MQVICNYLENGTDGRRYLEYDKCTRKFAYLEYFGQLRFPSGFELAVQMAR